ncbi:hypothetical protein Tco_0481973, partial [Tanacetum coccineum]
GGFGNAFLGWFDKNTFARSKRGDGVAVAVKEYFPSTAQGRDQQLVRISTFHLQLKTLCLQKTKNRIPSSDIWLDQDFNTKLGDFGPEMEEIAVTTRVQSALGHFHPYFSLKGYSDPYYCLTDMTVEVSELFTRELTRVTLASSLVFLVQCIARFHILSDKVISNTGGSISKRLKNLQ